MFNLTPDERKVVLFLLGIALAGIGINFSLKVNSPLKKIIFPDASIAKIELNKATLEDLLQSRALSKKIAQKIIEYRNASGGFSGLDELKDIKGIGEHRYEKLKELFFLE